MSHSPHEHAVPPLPRASAGLLRFPRALGDLLAESPGSRFLTRRLAVALGLYLLVLVSLASYSVNNDGRVYLDFMRRLVGESTQTPVIRGQIGSALFTLPFFAVARLLGLAGAHTLRGAPLEQISMVAATTVALLVALYLGWRLLRRLELPAGPGVLGLALFGTPLFYYALFQPTYKHVIDALFVTLAAVLLLRALDRPSRGIRLALGAALALAIMTRTADAALLPGMLLPFALRRDWRTAGAVLATTIVVVAALLSFPRLFGIHAGSGSGVALPRITVVHPAGTASDLVVANFYLCRNYTWHLTFRQCMLDRFNIWLDPWAPAKMLFTLHRGLFLWTPLTAFAVVGFALLLRRRRDLRGYLWGLAVAALGLLLVHMLWGQFWDNGFSFSQRFLSELFPLFLLGTAELVRRWRAPALTVLTACAVFSVGLGLTFFVGYKGISRADGVDRMVKLYVTGERTPQQLVRRVGVQARGRWLGH